MSRELAFRYFPNYKKEARFTDQPCEVCGDRPCLAGVYFGITDGPEAVCLNCLVMGKVVVDIPTYLKNQLEESVKIVNPGWQEEQTKTYIGGVVEALSRTPPVPWIQNNNWPVHHGDFCRYLGEWSQARLAQEAPDGDGKTYLMSILEAPDEVGDPEGLWESIADEWTAVFVFECFTCNKRIAIEQSY